MTVKGGTAPACAACKYQRRKCISSCPLAPYFPANQPKMFQNVHRLFGVSNVTKLIEKLPTKEEKDDAMTSIIYEAEMRERYPVRGCCVVIGHLRQQLEFATEQLRQVNMQLERCRQGQQSWWPPPPGFAQFDDVDVFGKHEIVPYGVSDYEVCGLLNEDNMVKPLRNFGSREIHLDSRKIYDGDSSKALAEMEEQMDGFDLDEKNMYGGEDFEEIICEDSYRNSSGEGSSLKDGTAKDPCRRELKTAAAGFSLTTVTR